MRRLYIPAGRRALLAARIRVWLLVMLSLAGLFWLDGRLRPMIKSIAAYQARVFATRAINESLRDQLNRDRVAYDGLVFITTQSDGRVSSVQTDMVRLNLLRAELTTAVSDRLAMLESQTVRIPIGTLLGGQVVSGRGPAVEFKLVPAGYVHSALSHRFDAAGINQTRHQIILEINANILAVLPGYTTATEVATNIILAETVIVGVAPESFTEVLTGEDSIAGLLADYGEGSSGAGS
jgi:sporulation protein YunB